MKLTFVKYTAPHEIAYVPLCSPGGKGGFPLRVSSLK